MRPEERNTSQVPATSVIRRVAQIFDALDSDEAALGINELARRTGLPKSTVSRLVGEMVAAGFAEREAEKVCVGPRVFEWGERASVRRWTREVAMPLLADLHAGTHLTVHLAILDGVEVVYIEILPSMGGPRLPSRVGGRLPAHATGVGKALMAASPHNVIDAVLATGLPPLGPRTIRNPHVLRRQLALTAATELAFEHEESGAGIVCVASAIRGADGLPVAAISAAGWASKVNVRHVGPAVQAAARDIGRSLLESARDRPISPR